MKNRRNGFTLGEVLIAVTVIGVIMAIAVNSIKIVKASYTSLTYFAFNNVKAMIGVLFTGPETGTESTVVKVDAEGNLVKSQVNPKECKDESDGHCVYYLTKTYNNLLKDSEDQPIPSMVTQCRADRLNRDGVIVQVFKSDNSSEDYYYRNHITDCSRRSSFDTGNNTNFCKSLAAISNTSGEVNCESLASSAFDGTEPAIVDLDIDNPNFIATNGQRYYISNWDFNAGVSDQYGYRLIAVDLNGTNKPNKLTADGSSLPPDIVTFMVMDNGEVLPLGVAADNIRLANGRVVQYLNSKVKGYYYSYYQDGAKGEDGSVGAPEVIPRDDSVIAPECIMTKTKEDGSKEKIKTCNYAVVYLSNEKPQEITSGTGSSSDQSEAKKVSFFSYREAYCNALGKNGTTAYEDYCSDVTVSEYCPPTDSSKAFDLCLATTVKPMFRYNFK